MNTIEEKRAQWRREHRPGLPSRIWLDDELRRFVDAHADTMSYQALVEACRSRFGSERAPSRSALGRYWLVRSKGETKRYPLRIEMNPDIKAFIDELLRHMSFKQIEDAARERFGRRAPSHSAIHRYFRSRVAGKYPETA